MQVGDALSAHQDMYGSTPVRKPREPEPEPEAGAEAEAGAEGAGEAEAEREEDGGEGAGADDGAAGGAEAPGARAAAVLCVRVFAIKSNVPCTFVSCCLRSKDQCVRKTARCRGGEGASASSASKVATLEPA